MNQFRKWMYGRYGVDKLNQVLLGFGLCFSIVSIVTNSTLIPYLSWILMILCLYRTFSKNIWKRKKENEWFLTYYKIVESFFLKKNYKSKNNKLHKHYKCPNCSQKIRVPKNKGKIEITCPKCRTLFIKRT